MENFTFQELYEAYLDCIKNKKSSKDYLEYDLKLLGNSKKFLGYLEILIKVKKMEKYWFK